MKRKIDASYLRAVESLDAGPPRAFRHIFLPLSLLSTTAPSRRRQRLPPGLTIYPGFYIMPILLGTPRDMMISQLINQQSEDLLAWLCLGHR